METIASIENMEDLGYSICASMERMESTFDNVLSSLGSLSESASEKLTEATKAVEKAEERVSECEARVESLESELACAHEDDDIDEVESELAEAEAALDAAGEALDECREHQEKIAGILRQVQNLQEETAGNGRKSLSSLAGYRETCQNRMRHACKALEQYLSEHPGSSVAAFGNWMRSKPSDSQIVSPQTLAARLKQSSAFLRHFVAYEAGRDPAFRAKIDGYRHQFSAAKSLSERKCILRQACRNGSGELAERFVAAAFRPYGDVSTQGRTYFDDGRYTKTDIIVRNLRVPVLFGRGEHTFAPKGGSLALEVKTGKAQYLWEQRDHLEFQAGGHRAADASATLCTADIHDLSEKQERELRERLRSSVSPIIGMLPRKSDIDRALFEAIGRGLGKEAV